MVANYYFLMFYLQLETKTHVTLLTNNGLIDRVCVVLYG